MKIMKKISALVIAMVMVLAMALPAMAQEANVYTVEDPSTQNVVTGHTYKAYQIFTADSYDTVAKTYGNLAFSSNVTEAGQTALLNGAADAQALAATLGSDDSTAATAFAKLAYTNKAQLGSGTELTSGTTVLPVGLWLIVDETTDDVDVINFANLFASDGTTAAAVVSKVDAPESDKKLKETNDTTGNVSDWQDAADYDIGDVIPFKLTATLPGNYTAYNTYHLTFHDIEGAGLTFNPTSVKVYLDEGTTPIDAANYTVVTTTTDGDTFDVVFTFANLTAIGVTNGSVIRVEYTSTLNTDATVVYGRAGNPNTSWITYDNNPNSDQDGEEGGETPKDTVIVFTFKTDVDKVDQDEKPLTGADFTLYKEVPSTYEGATKGSELTFNTGVEHSAISADKYYIVVGHKDGTTAGSDFTFNGVDSGTYVLVETTVPAGYNAWNSVTVEVSAAYIEETPVDPATGKVPSQETYVLTSLADDGGTFTEVETDLSMIGADIQNNQGSTLPSTGGIGTTIFYVIGGILVVLAGVVLVTKRKSAE